MNSQTKIKTSMLLHQLEESLGNFVLNNGDIESLNLDLLDNIHRREVDRGRGFNRSSIKDIVEATYLDELFGFALDIARDSSISDSLNYFYSLFHHLDIYEIRNAISHPNRPFWDCYWYRVAAIASDPVNEVLGFTEVKTALVAAEAGQISEPPEEWVKKVIWQIPNNLPTQFDHGLTGLIGRSKETEELKKFISNPRVNTIALVAPGGSGKTALALDLLNSIVSTPTYTKHIDAVVYITMKTEKLTSNGVISLNSIETIDELRENITESINIIFDEDFKSLSDTLEKTSNKKILLCIDNLETLLRDSQTSFEELNYELPPAWKILVTSRVIVNNSSILSLEALKEKSAIHLARTYLSKRGGAPLPEKTYEKLTKECFYNPLAIRLTIDLVLVGHEIPESLNVANKEIAEFSYNNLISALSKDAIEILEAVFVEDSSSRLSLCELLDKNLDDISSAIGELSKTSLISRKSSEDGEVYTLSDSVRDLLLVAPRNISIRNQVQEGIHKRKVLSKEIDIKQDKKELAIWHSDFIPKGTSESLKILFTEVTHELKKARKNTDIAVKLFRKLKDAKQIYDGNCLYHRALGRVLEVLKDYKSAKAQYELAIKSSESDPASTYLLARLYHSTKEYEKAYAVYETLIEEGWTADDPKVINFGKSIYNGYFLALLYSGNYETVFIKTKQWKEGGRYRGILGTYRASAWKRKMENTVNNDPASTVDALIRASRILDDVFRGEGYFQIANRQAIKLIEEIEFCYSRNDFCEKYQAEGNELLQFVAKNIIEISQSDGGIDTNSLISDLSRVKLAGNPFSNGKWNALSAEPTFNFVGEEEDKAGGLIEVEISNRPKDKASYLFARDAYGKDYFLHYDNFRGGSWKNWCHLSIGMKLHITTEEKAEQSEKAINAKEIYLPPPF